MIWQDASEFQGSERYELLGRIGSGGMAEVYRVRDRHTGHIVALKLLRLLDAESIYRFKQEFRSLSNISHRNLVSLYELVHVEPHWFFTMELVEGHNFFSYVRRKKQVTSSAKTEVLDIKLEQRPRPSVVSLSTARPPDLARLRACFSQLCVGVQALHSQDKLHRDIKPSNILVDSEGRVVVVDFGLVSDLSETPRSDRMALGTAEYMSPEQGHCGRVRPPSDWYSVGVVLYEALTGIRPYQGQPLVILADKQKRDPIDPCQLVPSLPRDLCDLCMALLARSPSERPSGHEVLAALGLDGSANMASTMAVGSIPSVFVGRQQELRSMEEAFAAVAKNRDAQTVLIDGDPGVGKSALMAHFTDRLAAESGALVLSGRCYERESVPFKAIDTLVDSLSRYLATLKDHEIQAVLPANIQTLARLFPVLKSVPAVARLRRSPLPINPQEGRRLALAALRKLLIAVGESRPLVLQVDDFQWSDVDSALVLSDLVALPDGPTMLLCVTYRRE